MIKLARVKDFIKVIFFPDRLTFEKHNLSFEQNLKYFEHCFVSSLVNI